MPSTTKVRSWTNKVVKVPCFLIGNGVSLNDHGDLSVLNDYFSIGINFAYKKLTPTILLWQDLEFFYQAKKDLANLKSILYCKDGADPFHMAYHFVLTGSGRHSLFGFNMPVNATVLKGRGASGPLAFQLAYVLGCSPIVLLGFDCKYRDNKTDFYGVNKHHTNNTLRSCNRGLNWIKTVQKDREVINCSDNNIFKDSVTLKDVINREDIKSSKKGKEYYNKLLLL
ncbi:MAG: hypothetical protein WDA06_02810 [Phenylobacterium sp.]